TTSTHSGYGSFVPYELNPEEFVLASVEQSELPSDIRGSHEYQHVYTDIRHSQPVTLGVSVLYNLSERWSLTSGLTYTLLSSELYSGSKTDNHYHHSRQSLHYVGVPLNVNYTVWRNPKISTYVSGGGLVEKNLWGKLTTDFVIGDQLETRNRQDIRVKPLQWSVNSAIGIQYQATRHIGLYAEPGVTYHFKNSSEVETIYKERPLNFNIRLGLRFSFNE
ncbi:MAG: PorT family protein, partial [Bacteroidales bacterium]|nr:PorT family protein [Bacteroidales bacterium]